jgi:tRNA A37 methylthiotransferase MiaB
MERASGRWYSPASTSASMKAGLEARAEGAVHTDMPRIRISSIEPWTVEDGLIDLVANEPRICRHLHLPLQHGSDGVLRAMGRPYSAGHVRSLMRRIREVSPGTAALVQM